MSLNDTHYITKPITKAIVITENALRNAMEADLGVIKFRGVNIGFISMYRTYHQLCGDYTWSKLARDNSLVQ